jgi:SAM-dependent methyltransferase
MTGWCFLPSEKAYGITQKFSSLNEGCSGNLDYNKQRQSIQFVIDNKHLYSLNKGQRIMAKETAAPDRNGPYDPSLVSELLLAPDRVKRYPRSSKYDPRWIWENEAGSHALWLTEALCEKMELRPGMRVLNLGGGYGIEAIFLAKEFGLQVWLADLGTDPSENWQRVCAAGVEDLVFPMKVDGRELPFADNFFDAVVSLNVLQFFGTDDLYLHWKLLPKVHPGGQLGVVVPGLLHEFKDGIPDYLQPVWHPDFLSWHSPDWLRSHWEKTGLAEIETADNFDDGEGYRTFITWAKVMRRDQGLLPTDGGRNISFVRLVARKKG